MPASISKHLFLIYETPAQGVGKVMAHGRTTTSATVAVMWDAETNRCYKGKS